MAIVYKVLGQQAPTAGTYTTPLISAASAQRVVSTITVANRNASADTFRIRVQVGATADTPSQYIAYDVPISGNSTITLTLGISLAAADSVYAGSAAGYCSFNAFGSEM